MEVGTTEPVAAQVSQVDSEATLQHAGAFALQSSTSGNTTGLPVKVAYDNLLITTADGGSGRGGGIGNSRFRRRVAWSASTPHWKPP